MTCLFRRHRLRSTDRSTRWQGKVHALLKDRHRGREFIEFLKLLDAPTPAHTTIHPILDNHSCAYLQQKRAWLAD
jgi:hypothetical protein